MSRRLWAILFRASYVSLLMDIQLALDDGVSVADIFRLPADRNYLILPRNDTRFAAGGLLIYPILGRKSAET
ncbi:MAG TPA: hypothetical protein VLC92_21460 [Rhodocyclaceae bacterium]|nr:hypothetical protein [Rhodocyclaceae bacterium]